MNQLLKEPEKGPETMHITKVVKPAVGCQLAIKETEESDLCLKEIKSPTFEIYNSVR